MTGDLSGKRIPLLHVEGITVEFGRGRHRPPLRAVDGVTFSVWPGETLGLVGESGSGKTSIARSILGLTDVAAGSITFAGREIAHLSQRDRRSLGSDLQVVFQDPYRSLNPTRSIGDTLGEAVKVFDRPTKDALSNRVGEMLTAMGLSPADAKRYPANFSGGQRQRISIGRALMREPKLVICDEPVSSLDLSVQAQILNRMKSLQAERGLSYLFISHDLPVVRYMSHRLIVLYQGQIMEAGDADAIYAAPRHPYTRRLLASVPDPDPLRRNARASRPGNAPRSESLRGSGGTHGCPFSPRCQWATAICTEERPAIEKASDGTSIACHNWREIAVPQASLTVTDRGVTS